MSHCKWCLNSIVSAFVAVVVAGPATSIPRERDVAVPLQKAQREPQRAAAGKSPSVRDLGRSVIVETRALDLANLRVADFGDLETSPAQ